MKTENDETIDGLDRMYYALQEEYRGHYEAGNIRKMQVCLEAIDIVSKQTNELINLKK